MKVVEANIADFCDVLHSENFSVYRNPEEEALVCVTDPDFDYVGMHLIPPFGVMNVLFCESWFGLAHQDWIRGFAESKKEVEAVQRWMKKNKTPLGEYGRDALYFPLSVHAPRRYSLVPRDFMLKFGLFCQKNRVEKAIQILEESEKLRKAWMINEGADFGDVIVDHGLQYYKSVGLGALPLLPGVEDVLFRSEVERNQFLEDLSFSVEVLKTILQRLREGDRRIFFSVAFNIRASWGMSMGVNKFSFLDDGVYREYNSLLMDVCLELDFPFADEFFFFGERSVESNYSSNFESDEFLRDKFLHYKKVALERSYWMPEGLLGGL